MLVQSGVAKIVWDNALDPIVRLYYPERFSDDEWLAHLAEAERLLARATPYAVISYLDGSQPPNATQRRSAAAFWRSAASRNNNMRGIAFVVSSTVLRGALTAVFWIQAPPCDYALFGTELEALAWARLKLGLARPSHAR